MTTDAPTTRQRKDRLKTWIQQLPVGESADTVRADLIRPLGQVPDHDVVEVEQELSNEGFPSGEVLRLCDLHSAALQGVIDHRGAREVLAASGNAVVLPAHVPHAVHARGPLELLLVMIRDSQPGA